MTAADPVTRELAEARKLVARGWRVFPVDHPSTPNCQGYGCKGAIAAEQAKAKLEGRRANYERNVICQPGAHDKRGKHPKPKSWTTPVASLPDDRMLIVWFGDAENPANIGIGCKASGLVVIDEDKPAGLAQLIDHLQVAARERGENETRYDLPPTYRIKTGRGYHYYFKAPEHVALGNRSGRLKAWGIDVRGGGSSHGGYAVGPGSLHASGAVYTAEDDDAELAELPQWLIDEIQESGTGSAPAASAAGQTSAGAPAITANESGTEATGGVWGYQPPRARPGEEGWQGWDNLPRYGDVGALRAQYGARCDAVLALGRVAKGEGGGWRELFYLAARDAWRLRELGLLTPAEFNADMLELVRVAWGAEPDPGDKAIVKDAREGRDGALASPWALIGGKDAGDDASLTESPKSGVCDQHRNSVTDGGQVDAGPDAQSDEGEVESAEELSEADAERIAEEARERNEANKLAEEEARLRDEVARQRRQRQAREILAAEDRPRLTIMDLDAFMTAPKPEYLVPGAIYRNSLCKVFGGPGSTKSFFLLDATLSLATGHEWFGVKLPQTRVDFVMAEGYSVNAERAEAWFHDRGVERSEAAGWFRAIPQGIQLTEAGIAEYLEELRHNPPGLIVLDTKNRMMIGEENSATDNAVMIRALDAMREASNGAAVVLVDHTGLVEVSRGRGSNALEAAMDTEIRVQREEVSIVASVTRDKAAEVGKTWEYRLARVEGVGGAWGAGSGRHAVVRPLSPDQMSATTLFDRSRDWWQLDIQTPEVLAPLPTNTVGNLARDFYRIMWFANDHEQGVTQSFLIKTVAEKPGIKEPSEANARRARSELQGLGVVGALSSSRYALMPEYRSNQSLGDPKLISSESSSVRDL